MPLCLARVTLWCKQLCSPRARRVSASLPGLPGCLLYSLSRQWQGRLVPLSPTDIFVCRPRLVLWLTQ